MIKVKRKVEKKELRKFLYKADVRDKQVYEVLSGSPIGVFQFSGNTAEGITKRVKPENFEDLVAINAFARPGTINFLPQYLENRETGESPYPEKVKEVLKETHFTCIYQEQVMSVFNKVGGFTLNETNDIRGLMKKLSKADKNPKDVAAWDIAINKFEKGALELGLTKKEAKDVADDMLALSAYNFNKSHAVAYSYVGFMCMYMTYYFKPWFYSAIIEHGMDKERSNMPALLKSIRDSGHNVVPPNINNSRNKTYADGKDIIIGIHNLKQIGVEAADAIVRNSPYKSFSDFLKRTLKEASINKRAISSLVSFGCFDKVEPDMNRRQMVNAFTEFWEKKPAITKSSLKKVEDIDELVEQGGVVARYLDLWRVTKNKWIKNEFVPVSTEYLKEMEETSLGFNFFISPFSEREIETFEEGEKRNLLKTKFDNIDLINITWKVPVFIDSVRVIKDKNGNEMAFANIEDLSGSTVSIPVFASIWQHLSDKIYAKTVCLLSLYRNDKNQIMLGQNGWVTNEGTIRGFSTPIRRVYE